MYNKVILIGNLTREVEVRQTEGGTAVASFGIACNRKHGEKEEVFFGEIVAWGKLAETCESYLSKGSKILVEGRLKTETWQDKEGQKKTKTRIIAENIRFLDSKKKEAGSHISHEEAESDPF